MALNYQNKHCEIAAEMLHSQPSLLDYRLIDYLNEIAELVEADGGKFASRQAIAVAIISWRADKADDFTKTHYSGG